VEPCTWQLDEDGNLSSLRLSFDNIGRTTSRNWVLRGEYRVDTGSTGQWLFSLDALKQQELRRRRDHEPVDLRGHVTPEMAAVLNVQWQNSNWDIALRGNQVGRTRAWLPGAECPQEQIEQNHCMNPRQLRWNLHLARRLGTRHRRAGRAQRARHATGELSGRQWWADAGAGRSAGPLLPAYPAVPLSVVRYAPCSTGLPTPHESLSLVLGRVPAVLRVAFPCILYFGTSWPVRWLTAARHGCPCCCLCCRCELHGSLCCSPSCTTCCWARRAPCIGALDPGRW
jgi:hypothetical protein